MRNDCRKVVSLASESRKIRKPLMEKKRRARINDSLEILKQILLESKTTLKATSTSNRNGQRTTAKLEKADILEMTVRYLQHLRNRIDHRRDEASLSQMKEEEIQIRPADSSWHIKYDSCVALVPARLPNGTITFVVPTSSMDGERRTSANLQGEQCVWRPW